LVTATRAPSFWLQILTELKNRGVADVCIAVCDGLKGLPEAINTVWELTTVQACIIHLIRNTFRYASRKYWDQIAHDLRPIYTAATEAEALARFTEFADKWGRPYSAIHKLWANAWSEFVPFLDYGRGDPQDHLLDECDRVDQRPLPASRPSPRSLPQRTSRAEVSLSHHPVTGPDRQRQGTMGHKVETGPERVRGHIRRPHPDKMITDQIRSTVYLIDPG
jgi:putative transposase